MSGTCGSGKHHAGAQNCLHGHGSETVRNQACAPCALTLFLRTLVGRGHGYGGPHPQGPWVSSLADITIVDCSQRFEYFNLEV